VVVAIRMNVMITLHPHVRRDCGGYAGLNRSMFTFGFWKWAVTEMVPNAACPKYPHPRVGQSPPKSSLLTTDLKPTNFTQLAQKGRPLVAVFGSWS